MKKATFLKTMKLSLALGLSVGYANLAFAVLATDASTLTSQLAGQLNYVGHLISVVAYVAGTGLAVSALMKFKAHKDNPTQEPISKPITLLLLAGSLLFLPTVMNIAANTLFGTSNAQTTGYSGWSAGTS